jgi:hypothetical protein
VQGEGGDGLARRQSERALTRHRGAATTGGVKGMQVGGSFVCMSASGDELGREGIGVAKRCTRVRQHIAPI